MPSRHDAIALLRAHGHDELAEDLRRWRNQVGTAGGWDAWLRRAHPLAATRVWPGGRHAAPRTNALIQEPIRVPSNRTTDFDVYWMVDWSARNEACSGKDSLWTARLWWDGGEPQVCTDNYRTRAEFETEATRLLAGELADARVLMGFDFPLGYPKGFARSIGAGAPAWSSTWETIAARLVDSPQNRSNRFDVAAELNALAGGSGPFFGVPANDATAVSGRLSPRSPAFPVKTRDGQSLARQRTTDDCVRAASSPWFLYGGSNSVGSQALTGIPVVHRLRQNTPGARVWPFETGARLPPRDEARVVLCEIYPTLGFEFDHEDLRVRDEQQVLAAASTFAAGDAADTLEKLFAAPSGVTPALEEEGWILGAPSPRSDGAPVSEPPAADSWTSPQGTVRSRRRSSR